MRDSAERFITSFLEALPPKLYAAANPGNEKRFFGILGEALRLDAGPNYNFYGHYLET